MEHRHRNRSVGPESEYNGLRLDHLHRAVNRPGHHAPHFELHAHVRTPAQSVRDALHRRKPSTDRDEAREEIDGPRRLPLLLWGRHLRGGKRSAHVGKRREDPVERLVQHGAREWHNRGEELEEESRRAERRCPF